MTSIIGAINTLNIGVEMKQYLEKLIERLSTEEKVHLSPADLTYKGLSLEQLQKLNDQ